MQHLYIIHVVHKAVIHLYVIHVAYRGCNIIYCVTLDPKIKETTQTTNQIKCECMGFNPLTQCDLTITRTH